MLVLDIRQNDVIIYHNNIIFLVDTFMKATITEIN